MGCYFLLQGIFPTQESNPGLLPSRQTVYQLSYKESLFTLIIPLNCQVKMQVQPSLGICGGLIPRPPLHPYQKPGIFEALLEHGVIYILPSDSASSASAGFRICRVPLLRFRNCRFRNCRFNQSPTTLILRVPQLQIRPIASHSDSAGSATADSTNRQPL